MLSRIGSLYLSLIHYVCSRLASVNERHIISYCKECVWKSSTVAILKWSDIIITLSRHNFYLLLFVLSCSQLTENVPRILDNVQLWRNVFPVCSFNVILYFIMYTVIFINISTKTLFLHYSWNIFFLKCFSWTFI